MWGPAEEFNISAVWESVPFVFPGEGVDLAFAMMRFPLLERALKSPVPGLFTPLPLVSLVFLPILLTEVAGVTGD